MASGGADEVLQASRQEDGPSGVEIGAGAATAIVAADVEVPEHVGAAEGDGVDGAITTEAGENIQDYGKLSWAELVKCDTEVIRSEGPPPSNRYRCVCCALSLSDGAV